MNNKPRLCPSLLVLLLAFAWNAKAQPTLQKDLTTAMEIPSVIAMESSPAHLYVLSDTEGMAVFRAYPDSLQWLYSSSGMQRRGNAMTADIRFAYLFGNSRRLNVLEPTSVLGLYSSTLLPDNPMDAKRMDTNLYIAMGSRGLGRISLSTPASVDSTVELIERGRLRDERIIDLEANRSQLFALAAGSRLYVFNKTEEGITLGNELTLNRELQHIFIIGGMILGSDSSGTIYELDNAGNLAQVGSIGEPVVKIEDWRDWLLIRGSSGKIWTSYRNRTPELWKDDPEAGNYFTVTKGQLWLCEYNQISQIIEVERSQSGTAVATSSYDGRIKLKDISDITVPYPRPVIVPIELEGNYPLSEVRFTYQSNIENARIRGNGFYWQPQANEVGSYGFKIIATTSGGQVDSTSFRVDIRSFNAPPRFSPIRPVTIPVGESFILPVKATDPDGMNPDLVRYLGVDLPEGSRIDESTGRFTWTPTARQVGDNTFQVIATDQYGAASKADITIRVIDVTRNEESGE